MPVNSAARPDVGAASPRRSGPLVVHRGGCALFRTSCSLRTSASFDAAAASDPSGGSESFAGGAGRQRDGRAARRAVGRSDRAGCGGGLVLFHAELLARAADSRSAARRRLDREHFTPSAISLARPGTRALRGAGVLDAPPRRSGLVRREGAAQLELQARLLRGPRSRGRRGGLGFERLRLAITSIAKAASNRLRLEDRPGRASRPRRPSALRRRMRPPGRRSRARSEGAHALTEKHSIPTPGGLAQAAPAAKRAKARRSGEVYAYQRGVASVQLRIMSGKLIGSPPVPLAEKDVQSRDEALARPLRRDFDRTARRGLVPGGVGAVRLPAARP